MSDWFDGLKWAEKMCKDGLGDVIRYSVDNSMDADEFDDGAKDYINHAKRLEAMGVQLP